MGEVWKKLFHKKDNFIILILAGVLLFVISLPTKKEEKDVVLTGKLLQEASVTAGGEEVAAENKPSEEGYEEILEKRLTEALSDMADVGRVKVMITLKSSRELVVEKETPVNRSATTETDSQGGSRTVNTSELGESVVYSTDGSSSEPYVVKSIVPEIEGVLVVAEGAGSGKVNHTITEIVQALFDVEAHKVKVVKMETNSK